MPSIGPEHFFFSNFAVRYSFGFGLGHLHLLALTLVQALLTCCIAPSKEEDNCPENDLPGDLLVKELETSTANTVFQIEDFKYCADIFIYRDSDRILETLIHLGNRKDTGTALLSGDCQAEENIGHPKDTGTALWPGDYTAVVITDSPFAFDATALQSFDSIELLKYDIRNDSGPIPIKSSVTSFQAGDTVRIRVDALRSTVAIRNVTNALPGYTRLENPRAHLENANLQAEVLRTNGFRPEETGLSTELASLPYDIGLYTQHPDTELYCYPNDADAPSETTPRTIFVFECEIKGKHCSFPYSLPALHRGEIINLSLLIESENQYTCSQL